MTKLHDRTLLETPPAADDYIWIRDKSDTTDSPQGTDKRIKIDKLFEGIEDLAHNLTAVVEPSASNDETQGYAKRSLWFFEDRIWMCFDPAEAAAVWIDISVQGFTQVQDSIEDATDGLRLVGDQDEPGNDQYYGTDSEGAKGWHQLTKRLGVTTEDGSPTLLTGADLTVPEHSTVDADIRITARQAADANHASFWRRALVKRAGADAEIVTVQTPAADIGSETGGEPPASWSVSIGVDAGTINIEVTGDAASNIEWSAEVRFVTSTNE